MTPSVRSVNPPDDGHAGMPSALADQLACFQPIVRIGVTGHRDLAHRERASVAATEALSRLLTILETAKWPTGMVRWTASPGLPVGYRVVSPLAEGADRLVAALVRSSDERLADRVRELVVPLPFGIDYYRGRDGQPGSDCRDAQSQAEFDHLRSAALWVQPLHPFAPTDDAERDAGYRDVGTYVVRHCDFLFALWDGRDNQLTAGTAAVVKLAFEHGTPVIWIPVTRKGTTRRPGPLRPAARPSFSPASPQETMAWPADARCPHPRRKQPLQAAAPGARVPLGSCWKDSEGLRNCAGTPAMTGNWVRPSRRRWPLRRPRPAPMPQPSAPWRTGLSRHMWSPTGWPNAINGC